MQYSEYKESLHKILTFYGYILLSLVQHIDYKFSFDISTIALEMLIEMHMYIPNHKLFINDWCVLLFCACCNLKDNCIMVNPL